MSAESHGLTREEDQILGGFGTSGHPDEILDIYKVEGQWKPEWRHPTKILQLMAHKGLLIIDPTETDILFHLTPAGKKLWQLRADEEAENPFNRKR